MKIRFLTSRLDGVYSMQCLQCAKEVYGFKTRLEARAYGLEHGRVMHGERQ